MKIQCTLLVLPGATVTFIIRFPGPTKTLWVSYTATDNLTTVEEVKVKSWDGVKDFLNERSAELDLEDEDINKLHDQRVKGVTFLDLNWEIQEEKEDLMWNSS